MQLATGRDRRKRFSLLRRDGGPGETLLFDALQTGLSTRSQEPKGCCGRLTPGPWPEAGLERNRPVALSLRQIVTFTSVDHEPVEPVPERSSLEAPTAALATFHQEEVDMGAIARGIADASALHSTIAVVQYMIRSLSVSGALCKSTLSCYRARSSAHAVCRIASSLLGCTYGPRRQ